MFLNFLINHLYSFIIIQVFLYSFLVFMLIISCLPLQFFVSLLIYVSFTTFPSISSRHPSTQFLSPLTHLIIDLLQLVVVTVVLVNHMCTLATLCFSSTFVLLDFFEKPQYNFFKLCILLFFCQFYVIFLLFWLGFFFFTQKEESLSNHLTQYYYNKYTKKKKKKIIVNTIQMQ